MISYLPVFFMIFWSGLAVLLAHQGDYPWMLAAVLLAAIDGFWFLVVKED